MRPVMVLSPTCRQSDDLRSSSSEPTPAASPAPSSPVSAQSESSTPSISSSVSAPTTTPLEESQAPPSPAPTVSLSISAISQSLPGLVPKSKASSSSLSQTSIPEETSDDLDATILGCIHRRAQSTPDGVCYVFLDNSGIETRQLTFAQVDNEARRIATLLQQAAVRVGDRAILCYPPGADFVLAFWGCLYAGVIACAVYPPHTDYLPTDVPRFRRIVDEVGANVVLTTTAYEQQRTRSSFAARFTKHRRHVVWPAHLRWLPTDKAAPTVAFNRSFFRHANPSDIAFLQYTAGATDAAKPVVISHRNLSAQVRLWNFVDADDVMVSWQPPYHENGLIGFNIAPVFTGAMSVQFSPLLFVQNPVLWMQMCSKYRATVTAAPAFAYFVAATKTTESVAVGLDLTALRHAICGAEPIRSDYLKRFAKMFSGAGFAPNAFHCTYSVAEATCLVCTNDANARAPPRSLLVDKTILEAHGRVQLLPKDDPRRAAGTGTQLFMASGRPTCELRIVDPKTRKILPEGCTGEIWLRGDSIAEGYWQQWTLTRQRFQATLTDDTSGKHYFRTSDLGFMHQGDLFFYSRRQDTVFVDGRGLSPQAVEASVESASDFVHPGGVVVFSYTEQPTMVVVVAELIENVKSRSDAKSILSSISKAIFKRVAADHDIRKIKVALLQPKSIPKTTFGKVQRDRTREKLEHHTLATQLVVYNHEPEFDH
ncbi:fatty-acid-CoA ligase [Achlya hypogyna]|uniref:Fatty-acid-CoA ligase n=1 Tax=Achlya hypogyna TaxID=1202772 RepID=A0A1V9Z5Z9_ACHHY|nr:fatty-acid-CoA ligase [Achlya hypogyna]